MICIYSQNNTEYSKNGDAVLTPISCTLAVTINSSWQLSLEHPYDAEERYKYIKVGAIIRADINCIRELGSVQQRFRIYQVNKGDNSVSAIAFPIGMEASYDAPIDNLNIDGTAQQAITALQTYTQKYTLSTDVTKTARASYANTNLITALASSDASSFLRTWGGELLYDNLNLKIRNRLGDNVAGEHRILYGKNLSSVSHELDDSGLITRIYPISIDGIRLNGTGYVDSDRASQYPVRHARYMQAPYNLIDQNAGSNSRTAVQTRTAIAAITNSASTTSHTACDDALDAGIQPEYIKSIRSDIISAVQTMALNGVVSASLYNAAASVIASSMSWLNELEQPEWSWRGDAETGYWYGNDDSYAKNMYVKISKTWSYFGDDGIWQEPRDDKGTWDWYQDSTGKKYGNFNKYFAHNEYVYITMDGVLTCYWFNEEGWYESEYTEESSWTWHGSGTAADPYWFGEDGAGDNAKKYAHDCWLFIDGVYYFFDSYGYYDGSTKFEDYRWDWVESDERFWFGNAEDKTYGATYLTSQWCKINGDWYYFDANGYAESANSSIARTSAYFTTGMAALATVVSTQKSALYTLLYTLMTEWCQGQYAQGVDLPRLTISIDMVDLSKTTEYAGYENLESVKLGDSVMCEDYKHNISTSDQRVIGLIYDCIRNYNNNVVLGSPTLAVSQMLNGSSANNAVAGGFDTSAIETALTTQGNAIATLQNGKQDKLTAGENITIVNNVISATGGAGLQYWHETPTRFYREGTHEGISGLANYLKPSNNEIGYYESGAGWDRSIVVRLKGNTRNVIMGITWQQGNRHPLICFASQDSLDFEWGYSNNTFQPPFGVAEWQDKSTYPVPTSGFDWYFGYAFSTATYNGVTWNILLVDCLYWDGGDGYSSTEGIAEFSKGKWGNKPDASLVGYDLLETANAKPYIEVVTEMGTQTYAFKYGGDDAPITYIDTDGNALFKEITTDAGSLTQQMAQKQNLLTAGENIQIDGDTISATDTDEISELSDVNLTNIADGEVLKYDATNQEWVNAAGGTNVVANPSGSASATLNKVAIDNVIYSLPSGGGGGGSFVGLTKSQYDALPTSEKEDTSKLYLVQEGGGIPAVEDLIMTSNDWSVYREGSMTINWINSEIVFDWTGGSSIGGNIVKKVAIPANASKIKFKITTGSSYSTSIDRFRVFIGVRTTYQTGIILPYYSINDWLAKTDFYTNNAVWEGELDLSSVNVDTYLYITAHGWDATVNYLEVVIPSSAETTRHTYWNNAKWSQWASNRITYGTTTPTGDANDGDLYILLDSNNSKQGEYLYMNNAWVQIE